MKNSKFKFTEINWVDLGVRFVLAILVIVIGLWIINRLTNLIAKLLDRRNVDISLKGFVLSISSALLKIAIILVAIAILGVDLTILGTILAASTLAVGMALQGSLSNIAGGALIMFLKPFRTGDYISSQGYEGVVKSIEIFYTKLNTIDNKEVILPNGKLSNDSVINYTSEGKRRVDIVFGVSYDADIKQTKEVLLDVLNNCSYTIADHAPTAAVLELADSSVNFVTRTWVKTQDYWDAYFYIMETTKQQLDKAGIEIPYPHSVEIHKEV